MTTNCFIALGVFSIELFVILRDSMCSHRASGAYKKRDCKRRPYCPLVLLCSTRYVVK